MEPKAPFMPLRAAHKTKAPGFAGGYLLNFRRRIAPLRPDVTVIYHATNDLSWETCSLAVDQEVYEKHGEKSNSWLTEHSQLWNLAIKNLRIREAQKNATDVSKRLHFLLSKLGAHFRKELTQRNRSF